MVVKGSWEAHKTLGRLDNYFFFFFPGLDGHISLSVV